MCHVVHSEDPMWYMLPVPHAVADLVRLGALPIACAGGSSVIEKAPLEAINDVHREAILVEG